MLTDILAAATQPSGGSGVAALLGRRPDHEQETIRDRLHIIEDRMGSHPVTARITYQLGCSKLNYGNRRRDFISLL